MRQRQQLNYGFIAVFIILWIMGPVTQLLQIIDLRLHVEWGLSERIILDPAFGWFRADELAIAWADMTYLLTGAIFVVGVFLRRSWAIPFGFYTTGTWSFILLLARIRWPLLEAYGFDVISGDQEPTFYAFATIYVLFGWFGMVYLWRNRNVYERI